MGLDKAIEHGKELRKPYYKSGKYDRTCRPGGGCPYCKANRQFGDRKRELSARDQMKEAVDHALGLHEATPGQEGIWAAREDDRKRTAVIRQDLTVLLGLVEQIAKWANETVYLSDREAFGVSGAADDLADWARKIKLRLKV